MYSRPVDDQDPVWRLIGGHVALDLVNTVGWRPVPERRIEYLPDVRSFAGWVQVAIGGVDRTAVRRWRPAAAARALDDARDLRERLATVLGAQVVGAPLPRPDVRAINDAWLAAVGAAPPPDTLPARHHIDVTAPATVAPRLALEIMDLLRSPDLDRLRLCRGDGCGWFFLDHTRNHSRIWCDAQDCGNRARVRRYAARKRA